jgi:DNA replication and repair protein RecF
MRLSGLTIRHFRNLGSQDLELPPEGVALIGDNAQGKSNFLEAIYYLETFRSFRGARDEQLISFDEDVFRVTGTLEVATEDLGVEVVAAAFERTGKRKKVSLDGVEPARLADALGRLAAVVFSPSDIELVSGGPKERRRFLDIVLSLSVPSYLVALQEYKQILRRRNASLKAAYGSAVVMAWNDGLVASGASVMTTRREWVESQHGAFRDYYSRVSGGTPGHMSYRPSVAIADALTPEAVGDAFREALDMSTERERRMGTTVVGPHRDDVRLRLGDDSDGLDLRQYGSGGQHRTAALALRLVEARTIRESRSKQPLILLDDVFAELDGGRSERVLDLMETEETGQVVLTAPKEDQVRIRRDSLPRWYISNGEITA